MPITQIVKYTLQGKTVTGTKFAMNLSDIAPHLDLHGIVLLIPTPLGDSNFVDSVRLKVEGERQRLLSMSSDVSAAAYTKPSEFSAWYVTSVLSALEFEEDPQPEFETTLLVLPYYPKLGIAPDCRAENPDADQVMTLFDALEESVESNELVRHTIKLQVPAASPSHSSPTRVVTTQPPAQPQPNLSALSPQGSSTSTSTVSMGDRFFGAEPDNRSESSDDDSHCCAGLCKPRV